MSNLQNIIKELARQGSSAGVLVGTVTAVDKDARTVDVEPLNEDAPVLAVNLQANQEATLGVVQFPRVGSFVVVAMLTGYASGVVVLTEDVESIEVNIGDKTKLTMDESGVKMNMQDSITLDMDADVAQFNGGNLGGLINIADLTDKLNGLVDEINNVVSTFNSHTHTGVHGATSAPLASASNASSFSRGDYEDETVKH